ncbi:hypothetical protein, partial [Ferriphaselus sp. R-1]
EITGLLASGSKRAADNRVLAGDNRQRLHGKRIDGKQVRPAQAIQLIAMAPCRSNTRQSR